MLSDEELKEVAEGAEVSMDDVLAAQMAGRAQDAGITFVAFTATPKTKTMELFGTRPDPKRTPASDNVPRPFHVYSMRQAIEEGFILDVLQNYTTYKLAFKLAHEGKEIDDKQVERSAALKRIMGWVKLHPYNIAQKVEVVVEHFRQYVAPLLKGQAKAMVVVSSRQEAVWPHLLLREVVGQALEAETAIQRQTPDLPPEDLVEVAGVLLRPRLDVDRRDLDEPVRDRERRGRDALRLREEGGDRALEEGTGDGRTCGPGPERPGGELARRDRDPAPLRAAAVGPEGDVDETALGQDEGVRRPAEPPAPEQGATGPGEEAVSRQRSPC